MQSTPVLINEIQISPQLRQAVEQNQRGDFGLLLAMLSQDARDWPQFHLQDSLDATQKLSQALELPPKAPLVANLTTDNIVTDHSSVFTREGAEAFRLHQCLQPEALVIRGAHSIEFSEVLENTDVQTRARLAGKLEYQHPAVPDFVDQLSQQRLWLTQHQAA